MTTSRRVALTATCLLLALGVYVDADERALSEAHNQIELRGDSSHGSNYMRMQFAKMDDGFAFDQIRLNLEIPEGLGPMSVGEEEVSVFVTQFNLIKDCYYEVVVAYGDVGQIGYIVDKDIGFIFSGAENSGAIVLCFRVDRPGSRLPLDVRPEFFFGGQRLENIALSPANQFRIDIDGAPAAEGGTAQCSLEVEPEC